MNRRDILRRSATAGLLAAPGAVVLNTMAAEARPGTDGLKTAAEITASGSIDLTARGLTAGDVDTYAADNTVIWEQATSEAATSGAAVYLPGAGIYRFTGPLNLDENVRYVSDGATLKLANGSNRDLLRTRGFETLWSSGTTNGPKRWSLEGFVLDGNAANQATGFPLSIYGRGFTIERVRVANGRSGGIRSGSAPGGSLMEARVNNVTVYNNFNVQLDWQGPNDSQLSDVIVFRDWAFDNGTAAPASRGVRFSVNANGALVDRLHVWGFHERGVELASGGVSLYNSVSEGAQVNVWVQASSCVYEGTIFGTAGTGPYAGTEVGYRLGVAGSGVTQWNNRLRGTLHRWSPGDRPIDLITDNGSDIDVDVLVSTATGVVFGNRDYKSSVNVMCSDQPRFSERMGGFSGTGVPNNGLGVVGSLYTRKDGATGSYLYRKGSAGWTPIL